eukprot:678006-Amphidinium_carterae.1
MTIKTSGKSVVVNDSLVWSFHMRRLSVVLGRPSQADSNNLFFHWFREVHPWPSFRPFSELRPNQKPEITHRFGDTLPSKVLGGGLMRSMSSSAQVGHLVGFQVAL